MYPPRDKLPEEQPKPSESVSLVWCGFMWLALGGLTLGSHKVPAAVIYVETAVCFWIQAWAIKAGYKRHRFLIGVSALAAFLIVDYFAGWLRS
jgi:hypothetical protein